MVQSVRAYCLELRAELKSLASAGHIGVSITPALGMEWRQRQAPAFTGRPCLKNKMEIYREATTCLSGSHMMFIRNTCTTYLLKRLSMDVST